MRETKKPTGLCRTCGIKVCSESSRFCEEHYRRHKEYQREYHKTYKAKRRLRDPAFAEKEKSYKTRFRKIHKKKGLCTHCTSPIAEGSKSYCVYHLAYFKNRKKKVPTYGSRAYLARRHQHMSKRGKCQITLEEFLQWWAETPDQCEYCGATATELAQRASKNTLQVDRKDNAIGYITKNMCKACWRCNHLKNDFFTYDQWRDTSNPEERFSRE